MTLVSRLKSPVAVRRAMVDWLRSARDPRLERTPSPDAQVPRFVTWPPVSHVSELTGLLRRVRWFLPPLDAPAQVIVPVSSSGLAPLVQDDRQGEAGGTDGSDSPESPDSHAMLEPFTGRMALDRLPPAAVVLLWRARSWRVVPLLAARQIPFFIVDPTLYASTEESEWLALYTRYASRAHGPTLRAASEANFERLEMAVGNGARINICGNGPGLERIYDSNCRDDVNIICNSAVRSERLLQHLRPTIIAFVNSPYFGPSKHARDHMTRLLRCAQEYGSFVAIPEGYAHHLLRTHCPPLASRIVALQLGRALKIPARTDLATQASANVLTSLMLPLAAALNPAEIRVWGCDGQPPSRRGRWAYLPGLESRVATVGEEHPAFVEALPRTDLFFRQMYDAHADQCERVLSHLEAHGLRIVCASPSAIPAFARRADHGPAREP